MRRAIGPVVVGLWCAGASLLGGCVTQDQIDARLRSWVGRDADDLASTWGAPNGSYQRRDGGRILTYERTAVLTTGPTTQFANTFSRFCRIDFSIGADGKVQSAEWRGSAEQCDKVIIAPGDGAEL
jgi:hypothetical protein